MLAALRVIIGTADSDMHSALAIANYFVQAAQAGKVRDLNPPKLHGLVYIAHGWLLGAAGQPIITGKVMANRDGVFIPELRDAGCWGTRTITQLFSVIATDPARGVMTERTPALDPKDPVMPALLWVWKTYGQMPSFRISEHIRELGSPWDLIWNDEERPDDDPKAIPNTTIKLWFRDLSSRRQQQGRQGQLNEVQRSELKAKLDETQRLLAKPDPNRLRTL